MNPPVDAADSSTDHATGDRTFASLLDREPTEMPWDVQSAARDRLPVLLDRIGVAHGVAAARSAAARGEPVLLLATWSRYGLTVLDELIAAGGPLPAVLDMAVFTSPEECRTAWPELADVMTLPVALMPDGRRVAGMTGVREALAEWQAAAGPAAPLGDRVSPADPRPAPAVSPAL